MTHRKVAPSSAEANTTDFSIARNSLQRKSLQAITFRLPPALRDFLSPALLGAFFVCASSPGLAQAEPDRSALKIEANRLSDHIRILASDDFQGREPGTAGEQKTIAYLTNQFSGLGLVPAGEQGGWTQRVPLERVEVKGPVRAGFRLADGRKDLQNLDDIVLDSKSAHVSVVDAPVVFIGFGTFAPERNWDDFKGVDLHGKIAVVLVNDPDYGLAPSDPLYGRFDGEAMTYYGRWTYKLEEAARHGARGILFVHEDGPAGYGWNVVRNSNSAAQFALKGSDRQTPEPEVRGWIQRNVAVDIFHAAGLDFEAEKRSAQSPNFRPRPLNAVQFSTEFRTVTSEITSHNVLARIPGTQFPSEAVLYGAHWDHLGVGAPDARGDRIYNGAVDNASGVATILEMARLFRGGGPLARSVYFIAFTGEEKGLLGSAYYTSHPLTPLATTVAMINIDIVNMKGHTRDISSRGGPNSVLDPMLAAEAAKVGLRFTPDVALEKGHFFRGDQFSFAKAGVPVLDYASGLDLVQGGVEAGRALVADYSANRYHQPSDEWRPDFDLRGAVVDGTILYELGRGLASSRQWPQWPASSPFRTTRDASAALRADLGNETTDESAGRVPRAP